MKPLLSWDGATLPKAIRLTPDERGVLLPRDTSFQLGKLEPAPFLSMEVGLWARPSASVAFPVHPVGAAELFRRAVDVIGRSSALAVLDADERRSLRGYLWWSSEKLFTPGQSVRTAIDGFATDRKLLSRDAVASDRPDRDRQKGLALLAAAATITAACEWAAEAT